MPANENELKGGIKYSDEKEAKSRSMSADENEPKGDIISSDEKEAKRGVCLLMKMSQRVASYLQMKREEDWQYVY